jgi:hypothetical protein
MPRLREDAIGPRLASAKQGTDHFDQDANMPGQLVTKGMGPFFGGELFARV